MLACHIQVDVGEVAQEPLAVALDGGLEAALGACGDAAVGAHGGGEEVFAKLVLLGLEQDAVLFGQGEGSGQLAVGQGDVKGFGLGHVGDVGGGGDDVVIAAEDQLKDLFAGGHREVCGGG